MKDNPTLEKLAVSNEGFFTRFLEWLKGLFNFTKNNDIQNMDTMQKAIKKYGKCFKY